MVGGKRRYNVSLVLGLTALGRVTCQLVKQNQVDKFIPENELPQRDNAVISQKLIVAVLVG
jgi:hypothetical protein